MVSDDDLLGLLSEELLKSVGDEKPQPQPQEKSGPKFLYFGNDAEARELVKKHLDPIYDIHYTEDIKEIPKMLKVIGAIILDPSCSTFSVGISLTKKLKNDFNHIKVFHILRQITHDYGVYMNNFPFQVPDYAAEMDQFAQLVDYIKNNI